MLNPEQLKTEWEEIFPPLPEGIIFEGVRYEDHWLAGGDPAGNIWHWHFNIDKFKGGYDDRQTVFRGLLSTVCSYQGYGEEMPWHTKEFYGNKQGDVQYPSVAFEWWPSRVDNELIGRIRRLAKTGAFDDVILDVMSRYS
jgi:hypothetical protein